MVWSWDFGLLSANPGESSSALLSLLILLYPSPWHSLIRVWNNSNNTTTPPPPCFTVHVETIRSPLCMGFRFWTRCHISGSFWPGILCFLFFFNDLFSTVYYLRLILVILSLFYVNFIYLGSPCVFVLCVLSVSVFMCVCVSLSLVSLFSSHPCVSFHSYMYVCLPGAKPAAWMVPSLSDRRDSL